MATSKVNEISDETLKSYIDKAKNDNLAGYGGKEFQKNRYTGIDRAEERLEARHNPVNRPRVHDLTHMSHGEAYDHTQVSDHIKDGDVMKVRGGTALMFKAWPVMVSGESDAFHHLKNGANWDNFHHGRYKKSANLALSLKESEGIMEEFNPDKVAFYEMLDNVMNKNIIDFQEKFNEVLVGRLHDAVQNFKSNLTDHVFNGNDEEITPAMLEKYMKKDRDDDDDDYRRNAKERTKERHEKRKEKNAIHASIHKEDVTGLEDEGTIAARQADLNLAQEKWDTDYETPKSKRGMWDGWSLEDLRKAAKSATGKRAKEIDFAIRAKTGWGKVKG